jgi:hypothetical protein
LKGQNEGDHFDRIEMRWLVLNHTRGAPYWPGGTTRKKFDPKLFQLGYVALATLDLARTKDHYLETIGLTETDEARGEVRAGTGLLPPSPHSSLSTLFPPIFFDRSGISNSTSS